MLLACCVYSNKRPKHKKEKLKEANLDLWENVWRILLLLLLLLTDLLFLLAYFRRHCVWNAREYNHIKLFSLFSCCCCCCCRCRSACYSLLSFFFLHFFFFRRLRLFFCIYYCYYFMKFLRYSLLAHTQTNEYEFLFMDNVVLRVSWLFGVLYCVCDAMLVVIFNCFCTGDGMTEMDSVQCCQTND